jgi:hypothetical protein
MPPLLHFLVLLSLTFRRGSTIRFSKIKPIVDSFSFFVPDPGMRDAGFRTWIVPRGSSARSVRLFNLAGVKKIVALESRCRKHNAVRTAHKKNNLFNPSEHI